MKALNSILPYLPLGRLHEVDELVGKPPRGKEGDVAAEDVLALGRGPGHVAGDVGGVGQAVAHPGGRKSFRLKWLCHLNLRPLPE